MTDLVEQLRAQSGRLREMAERAAYFAETIGATDRRHEANCDNSLADLIDEMLSRRKAVVAREDRGDFYDKAANYHMRLAWDRALALLADHVSAVLSGYTQTAREAQ